MSSRAAHGQDQRVVLAIDIGTSSVRALVCDAGGRALANSEVQIEYEISATQDGAATFVADELFALLVRVVDGALSQMETRRLQFVGVGVTSFWHSLLGVDQLQQPVTPVMYWADSRADATIADLRPRLDWTTVWQRTGCRLHSSYWPAKLHWLQQADPEVFATVRHWMSFTEYAGTRLFADSTPQTSISMASGTGLLDVHALVWDQPTLDLLEVRTDQLPALIDLNETAELNDGFAARWPALANVPWVPALGDGACANVGSGATAPDRIALTLGTSGAMRIVTPAPVGSSWAIPAGLWAYRLDRDFAVLGGALSNGGNFRRWLGELTDTIGDPDTASAVAEMAPDSHGLTILPFIAGERSPGWLADASGVIAGLTLATSPEALVRGGMEAVAYRFARIYDSLRPVTAHRHEIVANGGAIVSSPEWTAIIASVLGHDVVTLPAGDEATARGAALMTLLTVGLLLNLDAAPDPAQSGTLVSARADHAGPYNVGRERQLALERTLYPAGE